MLVFLRQTLLFAIKSGAEVSGEGVLKKLIKFNTSYKLEVMIVRMELHRESLSMFKVGGKKVHEQHDNPSSLSGNTNNLFSSGIKNILINAGLPRDTSDELLSFHHGSTQLVTHLALLFSFSLFSVLL